MKWLTNTYDPERPEAKRYFLTRTDEDKDVAWERWQRYLSDKVIGEPMPSSSVTVDEMKRQNIVGVYSRE